MNRGRPTRSGQIEIEKELKKYFERGFSATTTAQILDVNIKTVCKYFNEWIEQIQEQDKISFIDRQDRERLRSIIFYDSMSFQAYSLLEEVENEITNIKKKKEFIPKYLLSSKFEIVKYIAELGDKRSAITIIPPSSETLKKLLEEYVLKYQQDKIYQTAIPKNKMN